MNKKLSIKQMKVLKYRLKQWEAYNKKVKVAMKGIEEKVI